MSSEQIKCFVIMPFSETTEEHTERYWTEHFDDFLKPLIEENPRIKAHRSKPLRGDIVKEIINDLFSADIVVADLTDHNPNVFWELGVRLSLKDGTITIAENGTKIPFDVSLKGTHKYFPKNHVKMEKFKKNFKEVIKDCLTNPDKSDSCVKEALVGRGTFFEFFQYEETIRRLMAVVNEQLWNETVLDECIQLAKENKGKEPKDCIVPSSRIRLVASELLLTDRYVDADEPFYTQVGTYWAWFTALNTRINDWIQDTDNVGIWIIESEKEIREESKILLENVDQTFKEMAKKF